MTVKFIILAVCILAIQGNEWFFSATLKLEIDTLRVEFLDFLSRSKASYSTVEELEFREAVFRENYVKIQELNSDPD
jgi:hypothetical protein